VRTAAYLFEQKPLFSKFEVLEDIQEKSESLPKGVIMRVRGKFGHADKVTANGTLYTKKLYERETSRMLPDIQERAILMLADHPPRKPDGSVESPSVNSVIGGLTNLSILPDGSVMGEAELADTVAGKNIAAIVRAGFKIGISSRARGTATEAEFLKEHPLAESNQDWVGRRVKFVNEDFILKSFDIVVEQSAPGAKIDDFQEEETAEMNFDITKLVEKDWEGILAHDKVKALVEAKVKEKEEAMSKNFEESMRKEISGMVLEYLKSDEFLERFETDDADEEVIDKSEAKDEELKKLEVRVTKAEAENKKLTEAIAFEKDQKKVVEIVEESLKGKPALVIEKVRGELKDKVLTESTAQAFVKGRIDLIESICKIAGADAPAGKGIMMGGDRDEKKIELTEQEQVLANQARMVTMLG